MREPRLMALDSLKLHRNVAVRILRYHPDNLHIGGAYSLPCLNPSLVHEYRLALALTLELASMDRGEAVWQPYLDTLPARVRVPLFDFDKEAMRDCRGTYFHDLLCSEREDFEAVMKAVVRPLLAHHQPSFPHQDLEALFRRAFAIQLSRGFEAMDGSSVLLPVVDCLNGQVR